MDSRRPGRHTARGIVLHKGNILLIERWRNGQHYFSIPGGGIEPGESPDQTVLREILEETGCQVGVGRRLYQLEAVAATHYIYLCDYLSGEVHLPDDSPEAMNSDPANRFAPCWLSLADLATAPFTIWQPVAARLLHDLAHGFSDQVVDLL